MRLKIHSTFEIDLSIEKKEWDKLSEKQKLREIEDNIVYSEGCSMPMNIDKWIKLKAKKKKQYKTNNIISDTGFIFQNIQKDLENSLLKIPTINSRVGDIAFLKSKHNHKKSNKNKLITLEYQPRCNEGI